MNTLFRLLLAVIITLSSLVTVNAQATPIEIYGRELVSGQIVEVTMIKSDTMHVTTVQFVSNKQRFVFNPKNWVHPSKDVAQEELVFALPLKKVDFGNPVTINILCDGVLRHSFALVQRSSYGTSFLDFYQEVK